MKKIISGLVLILILVSNIFAQQEEDIRESPHDVELVEREAQHGFKRYNIGFKLGLGMTKLTEKNTFKPTASSVFRLGFTFGGFFTFNINQLVGVSFGLSYHLIQGTWEDTTNTVNNKITDFVLWLAPVLNFGMVSIFAGLEIVINLTASQELENDNFEPDIPDIRTPFLNFICGVQFTMPGKTSFLLGIEFKHGIMQISKYLDGVYEMGIFLVLGLKFGF